MRGWTAVACAWGMAMLSIGCQARTRYEVLSTFFDGVPTPAPVVSAEPEQPSQGVDQALQRARFGEHGPYAAKLCTACHASAASNSFVAPREQLCFQCHEFPADKKYVHGPLASGGCTACHDPHSSRYRYLLVSESDSFCVHCHDAQAVARVSAHTDVTAQCTSCHDPHMSDRQHLLR